jgi:hypothetical protein
MERLKNHVVGLGFVVAGLIGAAFGTGTAQAVVSTLVSVVNPSTSPVPTSSVNVTDPGRIAYQSEVSSTCSGMQNCSLVFPTVPAGHRVVVQHISGGGGFLTAPTYVETNVFLSTSPVPMFVGGVFASLAGGAYLFDQSALFSVDSGIAVTVSLSSDGSFSSGTVTLSGYVLDCNAAPCAAIAQ